MAYYPSHLPQRLLTKVWNFFLPGDTYFDFGDGHGTVRANQGINPDGSIRGWVARSAFAGPDAHVSRNAVIFGKAQVLNKAQINDYAMVFGFAVVSEHAQVCRNACVSGRSHIMGHAVLGEGTVVDGFATVSGSTTSIESHITDDAQVLEDAELFNCRLKGRSIFAGKTIARNVSATGNCYLVGNNSIDYVELDGVIRVQDCKLRYTALRQHVVIFNCQLLGSNEIDAIELGGGVTLDNTRLEGKIQAYDPAALQQHLYGSTALA